MSRCKECKEKFEAKYFNQKFCMDKDECIKAFSEWVKEEEEKKKKKEWDKEKREKAPILYPVKYKNKLQQEVNKLARKIDNYFKIKTCIDCDNPFGKQQDGGHFNSVGDNPSLRYNLHNIHSQKSDCNQNGIGGGRRLEYYRGLVERYGQKYADYVDTGLQIEYKLIKLSSKEVGEIYTLVRKLVRDFDSFSFTSPIAARTQLNLLIGIYMNNPAEIDLINNSEDDKKNQLF